MAADAGISTKLAAFHLDKLVDRGLLKTHFARPAGRSGPGAGRTAKFYEPSDLQVEVAVPPRQYQFAGQLLVTALDTQKPGESSRASAIRVARRVGIELGEKLREGATRGRRMGPERTLRLLEQILTDHGYEPYREGSKELRLKNCPFHELALQAPDLVCAMNHAFVEGLTRGIGSEMVEVLLEPSPDECCVRLRHGGGARR
ncbi:MAG: transcriptional regulator [Actinomycetota bacterium]|nr:transcriptional regulator [Actinomycetota bacterium]